MGQDIAKVVDEMAAVLAPGELGKSGRAKLEVRRGQLLLLIGASAANERKRSVVGAGSRGDAVLADDFFDIVLSILIMEVILGGRLTVDAVNVKGG